MIHVKKSANLLKRLKTVPGEEMDDEEEMKEEDEMEINKYHDDMHEMHLNSIKKSNQIDDNYRNNEKLTMIREIGSRETCIISSFIN